MTTTSQAPFTLRDGLTLALYGWPLPDTVRPRGVVLIVHGLGEHAWRYDHVARRLNAWGFWVRAYDQRGHGESGGARGVLPADHALLADLAEVVDDTREQLCNRWACPLLLLGHSMGGLVAARLVAGRLRPVEALLLSSPALDAGLNPVQRALIGLLYRLAPGLALGNGLDARKISHDAEVVQRYQTDRLVHDRISARLARFIDTEGAVTRAAAPGWTVPTLLMYADADALVNPRGSRDFAAAAPPAVVSSRCFDGLFHEIFNESDPAEVFETLEHWLESRF
ncbi:lysophospholipase [Serpentinimonas maccroryi]|uniref:Lysophospholipase n=1 Tax=Serpentinimonas maccroryi TaxID=1458426 RepID=A0A060NY59_9BURK|nr:alpha/beta hydrolase [Serpentinimonas maccroryi]MCM2479918.1 alpha/beta hydrolase [Serpentinimonas maccroryi]BAO83809.1 lysophospholipase [Serpentinimonas maccroryi]